MAAKTTTKTIRVTQQDIDAGVRGSFCECPVALALGRVYRAQPITVRHEGLFVGELNDAALKIAKGPPRLSRYIARFDAGETVLPTTFTVDFEWR